MLTRRQFLGRSTTLLLLVPIVDACETGTPRTPPVHPLTPDALPEAPDAGSDCVAQTSTVADAHAHMLCVRATDMTNPPPTGVAYTTSDVSAHTHTVWLTAEQLTLIHTGTEVTVTTSVTVDPVSGEPHSHQFMIVRA